MAKGQRLDNILTSSFCVSGMPAYLSVHGYDWVVETLAPRRVLLIGAGGHARVCLEALLDMAETEIVGALSKDGSGIEGLGVPILGVQEELDNITQSKHINSFCVAIGDNHRRQQIGRMLTESGRKVTHVVSRFALVSHTASIAPGAQLLPGSVVNAATAIAEGAIINTNASIDHDCTVGEYVHVGPGATVGGGVTIGEVAFVGLGARVLPGLTIGAEAVVGAGAVVIDDVPPGVTVVGVPARRIDSGGQQS
jgi:UDP-perosamine 4-acetyltransferase